jgi:hypothetical protein
MWSRQIGTAVYSAQSAILNVALDQPLYQLKRVQLFSMAQDWCMGVVSSLQLLLGRCKPLFSLDESISMLVLKWTTIFAVLLLYSRLSSLVVGTGPLKLLFRPVQVIGNVVQSILFPENSWTSSETVVPMPFEPSINEGWSVCKLGSVQPYGKTSFLQIDFTLPKADYVLPLALGQTIHICGLDRNSNAIQAEFYTFHPNRQIKPGRFSLLVPNPSKGYLPAYGSAENDENNNGLQQLRVVQMLQDYVLAGDKEVALQPGPCQLEYRGSHYPVTELIYVVIGVGIAPVLDQIRLVLSPSYSSSLSSNSGVDTISVIWINQDLEDFDITSQLLKQEYKRHPSKLRVVCGIEGSMKAISKEESAMYFIENNEELRDTLPTFEPGMMLVVAVEGLRSSSLLKQAATEFAHRKKAFPRECICVL